MAETTTDEDVLTHDEVASQLHSIAEEFETDADPEIDLGDEVHSVTPSDHVNYQVTVSENESLVSADAEAITIELSWELEE